ncbi:MAG: hypothetical protein AAGB34_00270 [Planctomycetota bacterium]
MPALTGRPAMHQRAIWILATLASSAVIVATSATAIAQSFRSGGIEYRSEDVIVTTQTIRVPYVLPRQTTSYPGLTGQWYRGVWNSTYAGHPLVETARRVDPRVRAGYEQEQAAAAEQQAAEEAAARADDGLVAFASGDFERAYRIYAVRATARPADLEGQRLHAIAAAASGRLKEAGQIFRRTYDQEPELRHTPAPMRQVMGERHMRDVVRSIARRVDAINDKDAWYGAAVMQHAAGNREAAEAYYIKSR